MNPSHLAAPRDPRLDFFRGLAILIIFIVHVPDNPWANYTPGRFGFSDSAEIFIFVSGYAVAIAFGRSYARAGFLAGTARTLQRCWQLYVAHLGLFFSIAAICVAANTFLDGIDYIGRLNLYFFFNNTQDALFGLFTLHYVPNYFDILPMYIVALGMLPVMMLLARWHVMLVPLASSLLYLAMWQYHLEFPAEVVYSRPWFFNPFGWQFLFFSGLVLGMGWIKAPPVKTWLLVLCFAFIIVSIPLSYSPLYDTTPWLLEWRGALNRIHAVEKTNFGWLRWLHFLALSYLVLSFLRPRIHWLHSRFAAPLVKVGQQALPAFLLCMVFSYLAGMGLDLAGRAPLGSTLVNLTGLASLLLAAQVLAWFKSQPWKKTLAAPHRATEPA